MGIITLCLTGQIALCTEILYTSYPPQENKTLSDTPTQVLIDGFHTVLGKRLEDLIYTVDSDNVDIIFGDVNWSCEC